MKNFKIIIITGLSGSGKNIAVAAFEDAGFYCVGNMPVALLPKFLEMPIETDAEIKGLAFVMDLREKGFLSNYTSIFDSLRQKGYDFRILFFEANEKIILQRYSQTRRSHPLSQGKKSLVDGIRTEQEQLKDLRDSADKIINTSHLSVHELKSIIFNIAQKSVKNSPLKINILSFGFKYGIPHDADLIMDVRFLTNPYFVPELKELDGKTKAVQDYILNNNETCIFLQKYLNLLDYLIPLYKKEGKSYLTIAVGCTGGRHRSVTIASTVFEYIKNQGYQLGITHRDIEL
jgi:UPF0042 nucleotide-binding protein